MNPAQGTIVENLLPNGNPTGTWTFTPAGGFLPNVLADIPLTFQIDDGTGLANAITNATAKIDAVNAAPTGTPTINDTTPGVGQVLTASSLGLADVNGLGPVTFTWQATSDGGATYTTVGTGATYTVGAAQLGQQIRVTASYTDRGGTAETVSSALTAAAIVLPPDAVADSIIANFALGTGFTVPTWALLANDLNLGPLAAVTQVTTTSTNFTATLSGTDVLITDTDDNNNSLTYTVSNAPPFPQRTMQP